MCSIPRSHDCQSRLHLFVAKTNWDQGATICTPFFLLFVKHKKTDHRTQTSISREKGDAQYEWTEVYNYDESRWRSTVKIPSSAMDISLQNQMCQNSIINSWLQEMCKEDVRMRVSAVSRQGRKSWMEVKEWEVEKLPEYNNVNVCSCWGQSYLCISQRTSQQVWELGTELTEVLRDTNTIADECAKDVCCQKGSAPVIITKNHKIALFYRDRGIQTTLSFLGKKNLIEQRSQSETQRAWLIDGNKVANTMKR